MPRLEDETGRLDVDARDRLLAVLQQAERGTQAEFIVRVVAKVPWRAWRRQAVADRARLSSMSGRSILILVAIDDRHVEVATAPRFQSIFDSATTNALLTAHFVPRMRQDDLAGALQAAIPALAQRLAAGPASPTARRTSADKAGILVVLAAFVLILGFFTWRFVSDHLCPVCRSWGAVEHRVLEPATTTSQGRGEREFSCVACGMHRVETEILPRESDSGSWGSDAGSDSGGSSDGGGGADW